MLDTRMMNSEGKLYNTIPQGKPSEIADNTIDASEIKPTIKKKKSKIDVPLFCQKELLALVGTAETMPAAPYADQKFEIWAVAVCRTYESFKRGDVLFEMHTDGYWRDKNVLARLKKETASIYMHDKYKDIPKSLRYPIEILTQKYRKYHTTSISYMLALAYHSFIETGNPKHVALFGIHMAAREEYTEQRPCCEYWLGRMEGAGIDIEVAPGGALLVANGLYGYENYDPICYEFRKYIQALQAGLEEAEKSRVEAVFQKGKQLGGIAVAEQWLRKFQRGEFHT